MLTGSALKNKGIQKVLDAVVDYLPSPLDVPPMIGLDPKTGAEIIRKPDDSEPFSALAFKIAADPFVGKLAFFRVYSGTLKAGSYILNPDARARRSGSGASSRCTRTTARRSTRSTRATSPRRSASRTRSPVTR